MSSIQNETDFACGVLSGENGKPYSPVSLEPVRELFYKLGYDQGKMRKDAGMIVNG